MCDEVRQDRNDDQSDWLAFDVRQGIERDLSTVKRRGIAAKPGDERVRTFVTGCREQENDIPD
jgi:hypothetical protein